MAKVLNVLVGSDGAIRFLTSYGKHAFTCLLSPTEYSPFALSMNALIKLLADQTPARSSVGSSSGPQRKRTQVSEGQLVVRAGDGYDEALQGTLAGLKHLDLTGQVEYDKDAPYLTGGAYGDIRIGVCKVANRSKVKVAVKSLRLYLQGNPDVSKLIEREVRVWSMLEHPSILPFLGYTLEQHGLPSFISEFMENGTVLRYVKENSECDVMRMVLGIADGVSYLHDMGIIHSDIKSDNVLISSLGEPLICDFGISRLVAASQTMSGAARQAQSSTIRGSARWMSPELLLALGDHASHSKASDIWAFGMTVYEILTQNRPYHHLSYDPQVITSIVQGRLPAKPHAVPISHYFHQLWKICEACWEKDSGCRPSAHRIVAVLKTPYLPVNVNSAVQEYPDDLNATYLNVQELMHAKLKGPWSTQRRKSKRPSSESHGKVQKKKRGTLEDSVKELGLAKLSVLMMLDSDPVARGSFVGIFEGRIGTTNRVLLWCRKYHVNNTVDDDGDPNYLSIIRLWSSLSHPNILPLLGYNSTTLQDFNAVLDLVTPWTENLSAVDYVRKTLKCNVARMVAGIAEGLAYMHSQDVVHGTLISENVFVSQTDIPFICGFDVAYKVDPATGSNSLARPSKESDVRSFGLLAHELFSEKFARLYPDRDEIEHLSFGDDPIGPGAFSPWPSEWEVPRSIIQCCLKQELEERPCMDEIVRRLRNL